MELQVLLHARQIGWLTSTRRGARFRYTEAVVQTLAGVPLLSASLPVQAPEFSAEQTAAWFVGLLPEDQQRSELERRFNLQGASYFNLLREVGHECAGAVSVLSELAPDEPEGYQGLSDPELARRLEALPARPFDPDAALRVSLGGYQSKLLVASVPETGATGSSDHGWAIPLGGAASTHILKPQPADRYPGLISGEAWAMRVAQAATATAQTWLLHNHQAPQTLVIQRFDRQFEDGRVQRIHQEDAAQAMGVPVERKYASTGSVSRNDPSLLRIAQLLDRYSQRPLHDKQRLLEQVLINLVLGNTDAHAKNYGLIHLHPGLITLSPMYDVVPAMEITPNVKELGLRVGGRIVAERVGREQLVDEAASWGLSRQRIDAVIAATSAALEVGFAQASDEYPQAAQRHLDPSQQRLKRLRS